MTSSNVTAARLHRLAALAGQLAAAVDGGALDRMAEWSRVGPSTGGGTGRGAPSDPTADAALAAKDLAGEHARAVTIAVSEALLRISAAARIAALYPPARVPDEAMRARLAAENGAVPAPGCQSCARIPGPVDGAPRWEPADSRLTQPTTAGGALTAPQWLCRWCGDTTRRLGRLPNVEELARHHRGLRLRFADTPDRRRR
jgi:hypothetical protein